MLKENRTLKQKIEVLRKEMTTAKAETSLQAQVVELENKLKKCQMQMSEQKERFRKETNTETDRLEKEVSRLKSRLMETIRPGRKCLVRLLPYCNSRYKNLDFVWDF